MLDETIAYLTLDLKTDTPWGRYWQVMDWMPFQLKRLRRHLVERGAGKLTVKKRGFPLAPEDLIVRLRLKSRQRIPGPGHDPPQWQTHRHHLRGPIIWVI